MAGKFLSEGPGQEFQRIAKRVVLVGHHQGVCDEPASMRQPVSRGEKSASSDLYLFEIIDGSGREGELSFQLSETIQN
jgi:hypothetical protein